jgi:hypothetical protein
MSLLSDIKYFLRKYLNNPVIIVVGAYLVWKFIINQKETKKENINNSVILLESIKIVEENNDLKYSIIFDTKLNKYILILNSGKNIYSSSNLDDIKNYVKRILKK